MPKKIDHLKATFCKTAGDYVEYNQSATNVKTGFTSVDGVVQ